jgi:TIR domain
MIFISYSSLDKSWCDRFLTVSKPLSRYASIDLWSDRRIKPGDKWKGEINKAVDRAVVAVLLVSINFLESDFVANVELPYVLAAAQTRNLKILWVRLTPCYFEVTPLREIEAAAGMPKALNEMTDPEWMIAFCTVCGEIDSLIKARETPIINRALDGQSFGREARKLQVLAQPAWRETDVLVYSGDGSWYAQSRISKGSTTSDCCFGDQKRTKPGDTFRIVALTRADHPLSKGSKHPNIPLHRTISHEVTVKRR